MAINAYLVRHEQAYLNLYNQIQGWTDSSLTPKGEENAKQVGRALVPIQFDYVFCSDLARTASTTRFLLIEHPGNNPTPIPGPTFQEELFGYFEGEGGQHFANFLDDSDGHHSFVEMAAGWGPDKLKDRIAATDNYGTAEDRVIFWKRVDKGFNRLRALPDGSEILVVLHGAVTRSIVRHYSDTYDPGDSPHNGSIAGLTLNKNNTTVDFCNKLELPE